MQLTGNGITKRAKTNNSGVYKFTSLPAGRYTLTTNSTTSGAAAATAGFGATVVPGQTIVLAASSF